MTLFQHLRNRLLDRAGIPRIDLTLDEISAAQWNPEFEKWVRLRVNSQYGGKWDNRFILLMKHRMTMGALRYGLSDDEEKKHYQCIQSMRHRAKLWEDTGDDELLVDVANLALLTYVEGNHRRASLKRSSIVSTPHSDFVGYGVGYIYRRDGDKVELIDIAARCMFLFTTKAHPKSHFGSIGENVQHAKL